MDRKSSIQHYEATYLADYGFEQHMVSARQKYILGLLQQRKMQQVQTVIEVGCGMDLLCEKARQANIPFERWIIIEPSDQFYATAQAMSQTDPRIVAVQGFFEEQAAEVAAQFPPADFVLVSSMLHEVPQPELLLKSVPQVLQRETGWVHINVPNALSLHRRLARAMGLIQDEREMGERNTKLGQTRIYSPDSLRQLCETCGFTLQEAGGFLLKPFTHQQMADILPMLPENALDGLWQLGQELPDLASEIYINASYT